MSQASTSSVKPVDREALRRELLKLIVKREAQRRGEPRARQQ